jgi:hypothetical protein
MPAWRWPGTEQKNLYVPAFSSTLSDFVPPVNVGVEPSTCFEADSIETLCESGDMLVISIVTFPAFAESDFVLYSSWPLLLASSFSALPLPLAGAAGVVVAVVAGVVAASLVVVPLDELPHPARATSATSTGSTNQRLRPSAVAALAAARVLNVLSSSLGAVGVKDTALTQNFPRRRVAATTLRLRGTDRGAGRGRIAAGASRHVLSSRTGWAPGSAPASG